MKCARIVRETVPVNSLLLASHNDQSGLLYYSERVGWKFIMEREFYKRHYKVALDTSSFKVDHVEAIKEHIEKGAEYYATCDLHSLQRYPAFGSYLFKNFERVYSDPKKLFIFKIKP